MKATHARGSPLVVGGFTPEVLDFIINYDIKYRMGQVDAEDAE